LLRGNGPLGPNSRRLLGRRLTRHSQSRLTLPLPELRTVDCASSFGSDVLHIDPAWFASRGSRRIGVVVSQASFGTTVHDARFVSPWIGLATDPIDRTRALFTNPSSRWRRTFRCFCTLTLRALLPLGELSPRNPPTSDIPCRLQAPSDDTIRRELVARVVFTSVPDLRRRSRDRRLIQRMLAHPPEAPTPSPFDDVSGEDLHGQSRSYATPVKGWCSLDSGRLPPYRLIACFRLRSEMPWIRSWTNRHFAHLFVLALAMGRVRAVCHGGFRLACRLQTSPCDGAWPSRVMYAIGFCHQLLQSRAPVPRSFFDEIASRAHGFLRIPRSPPTLPEFCSLQMSDRAPSVFTTPRWLWWIDALVFASHRERGGVLFLRVRRQSNQWHACRAAWMYRLTNPFALAHTTSRRRDRFVARPVKISPAYDLACLPSKSAFLQLASCDTSRAQRWTWSPITRARSTPVVLPPPGLAQRPFTQTMPCCFVQTRLSRLGPRSRPRSFWYGRFFGPDAAFRLLQRVFNYDTRAHTRERCPHPT